MTAVLELDTARAEYAKWFVQRAVLRKKEPYAGQHGCWISRWNKASKRGYIRYYKQKMGASEFLHDDLEPPSDWYWTGSREHKEDRQWWRVSMTDLDDPINDNNSMVQLYRRYRQATSEMDLWRWLMAEAEHHVLTNEAWLRAYGVEVVTA